MKPVTITGRKIKFAADLGETKAKEAREKREADKITLQTSPRIDKDLTEILLRWEERLSYAEKRIETKPGA